MVHIPFFKIYLWIFSFLFFSFSFWQARNLQLTKQKYTVQNIWRKYVINNNCNNMGGKRREDGAGKREDEEGEEVL